MKKSLLTCLVLTLGAGSPQAQSDLGLRAGLGRLTAGPIDADALNGTSGNLGLAALEGTSPGTLQILVSHRGNGGGSVPPHTLAIWDFDTSTGAATLNRTVQQNAATRFSAFGYRDGATDGSSSALFGWEGGIHVIDPNTGALRSTVLAANGPQTVANPIVIDASSPLLIGARVPAVYRALAFDAEGNRGDGSIFVGDFSVDLVEISLTGTVLQVYPNNNGGLRAWSAAGMALDTNLPNSTAQPALWIHSTGNVGEVREYALVRDARGPGLGDAVVTGRVMLDFRDESLPGGLDRAPFPLDGRDYGSDLIQLNQGVGNDPDLIAANRRSRRLFHPRHKRT